VASDVYSLGATIWNLLVGRSPFSIPNGDNSSRALSARILHSAPPRTQRPDVPPALDQLLVQCLAKTPEHRPASALELARALQRIETQSGFTRTPIAVEGDRPERKSAPRVADGDQTQLKPVSVVSGSAPRPTGTGVVRSPDSADATSPSRAPIPSVAWWALGAVALVVLVAVVGSRLGSSHESAPPIVSPTSAGSVEPGLVPRPVVTARRAGQQVTFRWRAADTTQAGDSYQWRLPRSGDTHLTDGQTVSLRSPGRLCLQVRLARAGLPPSTWASACS
jgi:serine/threonine protein kinase